MNHIKSGERLQENAEQAITPEIVPKPIRLEIGNSQFLEIISHGKEYSVSLIDREKNESFVLADLIPDNRRMKFIPGTNYRAFPESLSVSLPVEEIRDPREILIILHEIGHIKDFVERFGHKGDRSWVHEATFTTGDPEGIADVIHEERYAWAYALRFARSLKEKGFDIFKLFVNRDELLGFLHKNLGGYEELGDETARKKMRLRQPQVDAWIKSKLEEEGISFEDLEKPKI